MGRCVRSPFELGHASQPRAKEGGLKLTRVRREVFPEPLGPIRRIEGRVVRPEARNTTKWRKRGIKIATRTAMMSPKGERLRRTCAHSLMLAMISSLSGPIRSETDLLMFSKLQRLRNVNARLRATRLEKDRQNLDPCQLFIQFSYSASPATS